MRIKFLSFIASFFMVSFVITSCLDDDNNIEYSPDATIHAFALDTIGGYGVNYKFTIDQLSREIYNEDSLPVHADTIIDKILIKTLTTASGVVTMKDQSGKDSVINISDSIDLRKPLTIKVWSTEALANIATDRTREYTINVRIHKQDPDSMQWEKMATSCPITGNQKALLLKNDIFVFGENSAYKGTIDQQTFKVTSWSSISALQGVPTSVVNFKDKIYALQNGKVYSYSEATDWTEIVALGDQVKALLASFSDKLTAVNTYRMTNSEGIEVDSNYFCKTEDATLWIKELPTPSTFSLKNLSSSNYTTATGKEAAILAGMPNQTDGYTVPWFTTANDPGWAELKTSANSTTSYPSCPYMENPLIIRYNEAFYIFGGDFSVVHKSLAGLAWYEADKKFCMPKEFKDKGKCSIVVDANDFIWIIWNSGEVWRGRLNKLGFNNK